MADMMMVWSDESLEDFFRKEQTAKKKESHPVETKSPPVVKKKQPPTEKKIPSVEKKKPPPVEKKQLSWSRERESLING